MQIPFVEHKNEWHGTTGQGGKSNPWEKCPGRVSAVDTDCLGCCQNV